MAEPIKVMIVDDSAVVRQVVTQALSGDPGIKVIAAASDPVFALDRMHTQWPDVLIVDIEMPRMDGITFQKNHGRTANAGHHLLITCRKRRESQL